MSSSKEAPESIFRRLILENGVRRILVRVSPNQPRFLVADCRLENVDSKPAVLLKVRLSAPAEDGKANQQLCEELGRILSQPVKILGGHQSRTKNLIVSHE